MKQPAPDLVIAGKYCLESQLAVGGMGSVWVARHLDLDLDVAIKFMDPACATPEGRIRFEREAKAAAYLQSPHVVAVQDYGIDDDLPYIVMELLKGEDLEDRLLREERLPLEDAARILTQAARALRRAQELGIVHRDLKPHNIFLARGGGSGDEEEDQEIVKILDFGIAKETGPALVGDATQTGEIMGSPNYMSPEHVRGARDIDFRSDLWALGVIIFRSVTGRLPFPGDVVGDVIGKILADPIPRPTDIAPDLPPAMDDYFAKALARDRNQRFQSAREMADVFNEIVRSPSSSSPRISFSSLPGGAVSSMRGAAAAGLGSTSPDSVQAPLSDAPGEGTITKATTVSARTSETGRRPSSLLGIVAAAVALIAVGVMIIAFTQTGGSSEAGPVATEAPRPAAALPATAVPSAVATVQPATTSTPDEASTAKTAAATPPEASTAVSPRSTAKTGGGSGSVAAPKPSASARPKRGWGF